MLKGLFKHSLTKCSLAILIAAALCISFSAPSIARISYLGDLQGDSDASPLLETAWDEDGEPVSFDIIGPASSMGITLRSDSNVFYYDTSAFQTSEVSPSLLPLVDGFMVRTTQESGVISLDITNGNGEGNPFLPEVWEREADEQTGFLSPDYGIDGNGTITWDFSQNNPDDSRLIVGTMYLDESEIDVAPISSDCGVAVVKLEDVNYYFEVWGVDDPESEEESEPVFFGVVSTDTDTFNVLSLDLGSVVVESGDYGWLALVNIGKQEVNLSGNITPGVFGNQTVETDIDYLGSYTPNVKDDPAEFTTLSNGQLSPAVAVLLKTKQPVFDLADEYISIPVSMAYNPEMATSDIAVSNGEIQIHFSLAEKVGEGSSETFQGELGVTENVSSSDISGDGITVESIVSSADLSGVPENAFQTQEGTGNQVAQFSVNTGSGDFGPKEALPMVLNMNFILEKNFDSYTGSTVAEARTFLEENASFVKTWSDGSTSAIPLDNEAVDIKIQKTENGTDVMVTLNALIINGGTTGVTYTATVKGRPYVAIYDGTDDDSISDPITFEASENGSENTTSGGGGCSVASLPAILLLLLPMVLLKK